MGWTGFIAAFVGFFVLHSVPVRPPVRPWLVARLGHAGFGIVYSILSIAALAVLFVAADKAPYVPLWPEPPGVHWLVLAAMSGASLVLAFGLFQPNPLSFGGTRDSAFDPRRQGLLRWVHHPILAAFFLWSAAHLVANGDLAHAVMFGSFAGFALFGMWIIDRRRCREMGEDAWRRTTMRMHAAPIHLPRASVLRFGGAIAAVVALVLLHPWLAGVGVLWRFLP
ncbi:NnrU family protein [uncultured Jannaschia sp.]|uniref:NnrU family protein n=1 Tax=uncultured Jannaschia sp. TaxID=293347 RepID=UPI0026106AE5|nr:NnrU family protein [uncultured Jannaschia sp.]